MSSRKGSALLIVLGMLSFMVVSAVAFSAYMRYSRLPSSFLRQTVASRMLVKAALAEAIDEVDIAIGNNVHPGVGRTSYNKPRNDEADGEVRKVSRNRNNWIARVFIGAKKDTSGNELTSTDIHNHLLDPEEDDEATVSPLCLEALAYIPPPLVNAARYYSRRSPAAQWHSFAFDAGRYAFCALDVSDYFDVNSVYADRARSSMPADRVSLAYLFENDDHTSASGSSGTPESWDAFMEKFRGPRQNQQNTAVAGKGANSGSSASSGNYLPLVSMADWNLAINYYKPTGWTSPFCEYVKNNSGNFYNLSDEVGEAADKIRRMTFVSDAWFPNVDAASEDYDLTDEQYQPFTQSFLENKTPNLKSIFDSSEHAEVATRLFESISSLGFAALYDYLDPDKVPCSLSLPTTERVAMVCAVQPILSSGKVSVEGPTEQDESQIVGDPATSLTKNFKKTFTYKLSAGDLAGAMMAAQLRTVLAYPFRHKDGLNNERFSVDGRMAFFFSSGTVGLRLSSMNDSLRFSAEPDLDQPKLDNGVITLPFSSQSVSFTEDIKAEKDAVKQIDLRAKSANTVASLLNDKNLLVIRYEATQTRQANPSGGFTDWSPTEDAIKAAPQQYLTYAHTDIPPVKTDGSVDAQFANDASLLNFLKGGGSQDLSLSAGVWVRVKYAGSDNYGSNGKVVDFVPACVKDDDDLNGMNNYRILGPVANQYLGTSHPFLKFGTGAGLKLALTPTPGAVADLTLAPQAAMVGDPRYNHAPESWFQCSSVSAEQWLNDCHAHDTDRDGDIFMMVSDQGYLQSVYELANLPRLTEFYNNGTKYDLAGQHRCPSSFYSGNDIPNSFAETANAGLMWKTYDPFPGKYRSDGEGDDFDGAGFSSGLTGFKVNPYSDATNVMMAAFANTPHDWRCSSTENAEKAFEDMSASQFNAEYAWNEYSSGAKIAWPDLEDLCGAFMDDMRSGSGAKDWRTVWKNLGWNRVGTDASQYLLNDMQLTETSDQGRIWNCDKKFLYGYWHDCFEARQQLFLIFVRAEPAMIGGGSAKQTPPQLGGRAVALVWRDPTATKNNDEAHRTRVLFYRQFD